jgi:hypothetical protein
MAKRKEQAPIAVIKDDAESLLAQIREEQSAIDQALAEGKSEMEKVVARYDEKVKPLLESRDQAIGVLIKLMKSNRKILFADTDVISLNSGRLLHSKEDKVTIPRDALDKCKAQGFTEVVKVAESLDREAVEKWTDEKLFLIGATRKPKETFKYEVKK